MASQPLVHDAQHGDGHAHPSQGTYVKIAAFLAIITAVEVLIYYVNFFESVLVPLLVILSAVKFVTVVGYFMHLKFDNRMLGFMFAAAMIISLAVFIGTFLVMDNDAVTHFIGDMSV
jgi:cytochrome c oxidase subunit IV